MSATRGDGELQMEDWGAGPAVVLLHGAPSSLADFAPLVDRLARDHRVLVPHLPGYGRTPAGPGSYSVAEVIAQVEAALRGAGIVQADVVGFSAGAYKAVAIALGGHIEVRRLVLLAPLVGMDAAVAQGYRDLAAAVRTGAFDARPSWLERMTGPGFAARNPAGASRVLAWLDAAPQAVMCDELEALADAPDLRPRLQTLRCPALVCAGTHDAAIPMAWAEEAARRLSHVVLERFEGVGHAILIEEPERAARLVGAFLTPAPTSERVAG